MYGRRFFGYLQNYRDREFYESHKNLCFTKVDGVEENYPIVSVMKTGIDSDCYRYTDIYNDEEYRNLVKRFWMAVCTHVRERIFWKRR